MLQQPFPECETSFVQPSEESDAMEGGKPSRSGKRAVRALQTPARAARRGGETGSAHQCRRVEGLWAPSPRGRAIIATAVRMPLAHVTIGRESIARTPWSHEAVALL